MTTRIVDRTQAYALSQHASHELHITHPGLWDLIEQSVNWRLILAFTLNGLAWFAICKGLIILWAVMS